MESKDIKYEEAEEKKVPIVEKEEKRRHRKERER